MNKSIYKVKITHELVDHYGHLNHVNYIKLFEDARWDYYAKNGFSKDIVTKNKLGPVIFEVNVKYRKEVSCGEEVLIETFFLPFRGPLARIKHVLYNSSNQVSCKAEVVIGIFDTSERKLVLPSNSWKKLFLKSE